MDCEAAAELQARASLALWQTTAGLWQMVDMPLQCDPNEKRANRSSVARRRTRPRAYTQGLGIVMRGTICLLLVSLAAAGCGGNCRAVLSSGSVVSCAVAPPGPDDPDFGDAAQVLVVDGATGNLLWIGINGGTGPGTAFANFQSLYCAGTLAWIGGPVVVATDQTLGFFFDPDQNLAAEIVAANQQTTISAITSDPLAFAPEDGSNLQWAVPADVVSVEVTAPGLVGDLTCPTPTPTP